MAALDNRQRFDRVSPRLASLAARSGLSTSALAVHELTEAARHAADAALLGEDPAAPVDVLDASAAALALFNDGTAR